MNGIVLIDGNSIGFAAQSSNKLTAGDTEVQGLFYFLKTMRVILETYPGRTPIVLWDGKSWRYDHFAGYKSKRKEDPKAVALKDGWKKIRPQVARALKTLGVHQIMALNLEADDLTGMLTAKARAQGQTVVLVSGDTDWLQLVEAGVLWHDPIRERIVNHRNFHTNTGFVNGRALLQGKALKGDSSDCIPGVGGLGEKAAPILLELYGSVEKFWAEAEKPGFELPEELRGYRKKLTDFCKPEGRSRFAFNMLLMDLKTNQRPKPERLMHTKPAFNSTAFRAVCDEFAFHSILRNFNTWTEPFAALSHSQKEAA